MGGLAARFRDDADDIALLDARSHRRRQLVREKDGALRRVADPDLLLPQQNAEKSGLDVFDVRRALAHHFVLHGGENADEHVAHALVGGLRALAHLDHVFRLALQRGVVQEGNVSLHDERFLLARRFSERLRVPLGLRDEFVHRGAESLDLRLGILYGVRGICQ